MHISNQLTDPPTHTHNTDIERDTCTHTTTQESKKHAGRQAKRTHLEVPAEVLECGEDLLAGALPRGELVGHGVVLWGVRWLV